MIERFCLITKNPCGTDTWGTSPCPCRVCQAWNVKAEEIYRKLIEKAERHYTKHGGFAELMQIKRIKDAP